MPIEPSLYIRNSMQYSIQPPRAGVRMVDVQTTSPGAWMSLTRDALSLVGGLIVLGFGSLSPGLSFLFILVCSSLCRVSLCIVRVYNGGLGNMPRLFLRVLP